MRVQYTKMNANNTLTAVLQFGYELKTVRIVLYLKKNLKTGFLKMFQTAEVAFKVKVTQAV